MAKIGNDKPDFYITSAADYEEGVAALADEARYNGNSEKGKVTVFVILMPESKGYRHERNDPVTNVGKASAGGELRRGETTVIAKRGQDGCNLIVGTALDRIRIGRKDLKVFVNADMPDAKDMTSELRRLFASMKVPGGFVVQEVDPRMTGFEITEPPKRKTAEVVSLKGL